MKEAEGAGLRNENKDTSVFPIITKHVLSSLKRGAALCVVP